MAGAALEPIGLSRLRDDGGAALTRALAADPTEAARWLHAAARYGLVEAQTALAQCLLDGRGVGKAEAAAFGWFEIAARAGHVPAVNMVGRCCERGWGVVVDLTRAAAAYRQAAEAGYDWGEYNLANMMLRGRGVPRDPTGALALFKRAAAQSHAKSMNLVGRFLEEGWVGPADAKTAAAWYFRAAEGGDFRGQYNLASLLALHGRIPEAAAWLRHALKTASSDFLGVMAARLEQNPYEELRAIGLTASAKQARAGDCSTGSRCPAPAPP